MDEASPLPNCAFAAGMSVFAAAEAVLPLNGPESAYTARAAFHGFAFPGARSAGVMWAVPIAAAAMGPYRSGATGVQ
ncbi:hypothetical protein ACFTAO_43685 [Paenibacillus rhizoplanae]